MPVDVEREDAGLVRQAFRGVARREHRVGTGEVAAVGVPGRVVAQVAGLQAQSLGVGMACVPGLPSRHDDRQPLQFD